MSPYPLGLMLGGRRVLVVGGGAVATRRMPALLECGAAVVVVSPSLTPALQALAQDDRLLWIPRRFEDSDVDGAWLVHVAVDDPSTAAAVSVAAEARRVFCVRADDRHAASAWTPAITRHGPVTVAVSGGGDVRLAMAVRDAVAALLSAGLPEVSPQAVEGRAAVVTTDAGSGASAGSGMSAGSVASGGSVASVGSVALVGAGPGDPELITVRGRRLLASADVVIADRLAPGLLLDELRPEVELVDASKIPYGPAKAQREINRLLVEHALAGRRVVRLKGGDPFVFGRGAEEVAACAEAGFPVTVVPGVTSAIAVPAAAGIPVTQRGIAHEFTVVSGHLAPGDPASLVDWPALARLRGTLCVLMGLRQLAAIADALVTHGKPADTPAAVVQDGTTAGQRVVRATLGTVAAEAAAQRLRPPAVVVIGPVAG